MRQSRRRHPKSMERQLRGDGHHTFRESQEETVSIHGETPSMYGATARKKQPACTERQPGGDGQHALRGNHEETASIHGKTAKRRQKECM
jgi:hypothetical protein